MPSDDSEMPYRLAEQLWSPKFADGIRARLSQVKSLGEGAPLVALAGTVPTDSMRSALHKVLQGHASEGPAGLAPVGFGTLISDPGLVALVKMLPRKGAPPPPRPARTRTKPGRGRTDQKTPSSSSTMASRRAKLAAEIAAKASAGDDKGADRAWMNASEDLVRRWCERFQGAAEAGAAADAAEVAAKLPFKLHSSVEVLAAYHINLPGGVQDKLSELKLDPLEVVYVRLQQNASIGVATSYYRRQLGVTTDDVRQIAHGVWIDSLGEGSQPDRTRSIDVMVTKVEDLPDRPSREKEDLMVDILSIEVRSPTEAKKAPAKAKKAPAKAG